VEAKKNVICVVVDRLHAGMIGAYGNSWIRTPELDHLASQSLLLDQAMINGPELEQFYCGCWQGGHPAFAEPVCDKPTLIALARAAGISATLMTDEPRVAQLPAAEEFNEQIYLEPSDAESVADDLAETHLARFFAAAVDRLQAAKPPLLLWIHTQGFGAAWDAPLEFRNQYADEEDPVPPRFAAVPSCTLGSDHDPDELLGVTHAYAGQVSLLDACVGVLLDDLVNGPLAANTLFVLLSARGFPLGEHGRVGPRDPALYGETVQIPWMMRFPDGSGALARTQALAQPADLFATLADWWGLQTAGAPAGKSLIPLAIGQPMAFRDRVFTFASDQERSIRTPAWFARLEGPLETAAVELFAKPGDRWEVNEVANRCPDVAAGLRSAWIEFQQQAAADQAAPLDALLVTPLD